MPLVCGAVGLWSLWLGQPVFDTQALAQLIELVLSRGLATAAAKQPVRELFAVVCQDSLNLERRSLGHCGQEGLVDAAVLCCLIPAGGPVDGHIAALVLILSLGQVTSHPHEHSLAHTP